MGLSERTKNLLRKGERVDVEYKTKVTQDFNDILVAFANSDGGTCIFGVQDDKDEEGRHIGKVVGLEISDKTRGQIQSRADQTNDKIEIVIESEFDDSGKGIFIVTILEGKNKPYCTGGGKYLIRRDGQNCAISPNMMERIIEHRINTSPASQPIVRMLIKEINLNPKLKCKSKIQNIRDLIEKEEIRRNINLSINVVNIGNFPAQNILLDANVIFKKRNPLGYSYLPIHLPKFVDFLSTASTSKETSEIRLNVAFDNFVAKETILDFIDGRINFPGSAFLPTFEEMKNRDLWPSPAIEIRCLYSDVSGQNYCSEKRLYFHLYCDSEEGHIDIYILNMAELEFGRISKISDQERQNYIRSRRHLRYTAFDGKKYEKDDLILLLRANK